jgi:uncharacterized membrane protein
MTTITPSTDSVAATSAPPDVLAIALDDRLRGQELLLAATRLGRHGSVQLTDAALVGFNKKGKPHLTQTREVSPPQGAMMGAWWGSLVGLFVFGILGWLIGAILGAGIGWLWARRRDVGVPDDWMKGLASRLSPGEVAAVFEMHNIYPTHLMRELRRFDGRLLTTTIDADRAEIEEALAYSI